jgi:hypothetical protein
MATEEQAIRAVFPRSLTPSTLIRSVFVWETSGDILQEIADGGRR